LDAREKTFLISVKAKKTSSGKGGQFYARLRSEKKREKDSFSPLGKKGREKTPLAEREKKKVYNLLPLSRSRGRILPKKKKGQQVFMKKGRTRLP